MAGKAVTPMMEQYREVRSQLPPEALLLFRLGDFYEMFEEDAVRGAQVLGITLTKRHETKMAGIPFHAAEAYIGKLLTAGIKVAICDQVETPKPGKLVKRSLTRILTPGTIIEDPQLEASKPSYLLALAPAGQSLTAAWADVSAGEFWLASPTPATDLLALLDRVDPREILLPPELRHPDPSLAYRNELLGFLQGRNLTERDKVDFDHRTGAQSTKDFFGVLNLSGFGIEEEDEPALAPSGALIRYLEETFRTAPRHFKSIRKAETRETLLIDPATSRNLEILRGSDGSRRHSLIEAVDRTQTAPGGRLLVEFLTYPCRDLAEIKRRQLCVATFHSQPFETENVREALTEVRDLPRILSRLQNRLQNPRELASIRETLRALPGLKKALSNFGENAFPAELVYFPETDDLKELLAGSIADDPPAQLNAGGTIRKGYDNELDRLRRLSLDSKSWVADQEASERERTGLKNLKIKFNNAFGYFIEIPKSQAASAPPEYVRRQTLVNAERFTTPDLKAKEREILEAEEASLARESELFEEVVAKVLKEADTLRALALLLAEIDLFSSWGILAREQNYCCPNVDESSVFDIKEGRHPVVEQELAKSDSGLGGSETFVPNDCLLDAKGCQIALITGPNMAGKSTFIRQVALIALLAQTGCWVPAKSCRLGWVDRIFSRVGASDELARGNSTFMVEMNETANILHNATARSLIILDEVGRGTSTYDGMSIAWSVAEFLHGTNKEGPRTLFATHYHELTELANILPRLHNFTVAVREWEDSIIFLRQVVKGTADRSYGIHVARLAGLPDTVINRAQELLSEFETSSGAHPARRKPPKEKNPPPPDPQLNLFAE